MTLTAPSQTDRSDAKAGPLSPDDLRALSDARVRARKVRRAASVAALSGWTMAIFAVLTFLGGLFGDLAALALGAALGILAIIELRGAASLRRFQPSAPKHLGLNQIALGALLVLYGGWSLIHALRHPMLESAGGTTGDAQIDAALTNISTIAFVALYGGVALVGVIGPGLTALYYFTRESLVRQMIDQTPPWVIQTIRAVG